ncbi:hypothetical protein NBRC110019_29790 [Neptunitalea chrysea]|uniref:Adhesin domain-containing protein n=1 Tax=Neptunitalea chrysea TaxID=1647581 RepID=A0A9W6B9J3_9FLAO|nr:hypothetical protein [Neptunitalea chrysea]GLB53938.1 hypothetical protein NBRC110019_29790 [Neptunitalea chrysea]
MSISRGVVYIYVLLGCMANVFAQKVSTKLLQIPNVEYITINTDIISDLELTTDEAKTVFVEAQFDGEYNESLFITTKQEGSQLDLGVHFGPIFENFDDKLAANKQLSIKMKVVVPKNSVVIVNGTSTITHVSGDYKKIQLYMHDGNCYVSDVKGEGEIVTFSGDVLVESYNGEIIANSDYGMVKVVKQIKYPFKLNIHSVKGDIRVNTIK